MFAAFARGPGLGIISKKQHLVHKAWRNFSVLENKKTLFDSFEGIEDENESGRNGLKLPPFGSIVSYTTQRQYHIGIYEGIKSIDGIQKLQIRNEHACIHDVVCILSSLYS